MSGEMKKVVFTGGHHTSSLVVVEELLKSRKDIEIIWIGHKFSAWRDLNLSLEYKEVTSLGIPFYNLYAGKVYRIFNPLKLVRIPFGFIQALLYLIKIKPYLIVSFGGYLSVPVSFWAYVFKIPVILHEQTLHGGWANIFVSKFAAKILLTWESSKKLFPALKSKVIGLPMLPGTFATDITKNVFNNKLPVILITGGKQGSHKINKCIGSLLNELLNICNVILQCGDNSKYKDFDNLNKLVNLMPTELKDRFIIRKHLTRQEMLGAIKRSNLLIGRSGAHFIYEVCFYEKPALLIPLPNTSHNEQARNANFVKSVGLAKVLEQKDLSKGAFLRDIEFMLKNLDLFTMVRRVNLPKDAHKKFVEEINKVI